MSCTQEPQRKFPPEQFNQDMEFGVKLFEVGMGETLQGKELLDFVNFFLIRFPSCKDLGYAEEWACRFAEKREMGCADHESRLIILALRKDTIHSMKIRPRMS